MKKKNRSWPNTTYNYQDMDNYIIPIDECRKYIKDQKVTDEELKKLRNNLIGITSILIDDYLKMFD